MCGDHHDLYDKYINKELTLDQLRCRIAKRDLGVKVSCLDDLKGIIRDKS